MTHVNNSVSLQQCGITGAIFALLGCIVGCTGPGPGGGGTVPLVCVELSSDITTDTTLALPCYDVTTDIFVENGATLTIAPGVTLRFSIDTKLQISDDGTLIAVGTAADPILLTGEQEIRGFWDGVYFRDSVSFFNQLDYVTIEYGGGRDFSGGAQGNVVLQGFGSATPVRANITNCTLRESSSYGFYFDDEAVVNDFGNNTVTANTLGAGYVLASVASILDASGSYTGNDVDAILVEGNTMNAAQVLQQINVDYLIMDRFIVDASLTVDAGARLVFAQDASLEVRGDGELIAVGTAANPILFTGEQSIPGYWGGIYLRDSNSFSNQMDYVTVEYGGSRNFALGAQGNLALQEFGVPVDVRMNITNSTFQHSSTYGIWADKEAIVNPDVETANTFNNNASGDFFREP